jgi:transposase
MTIIPALPNLLIDEVQVAEEITISLRATSTQACCLCCGTPSSRVQSCYLRILHDLPSSGRPVHLVIRVRRFFCQQSTCPRKIFAEQFPELCRPHAQRTSRLQEALVQLGFVLGGQAGTRLGSVLGISGSQDTILRLVRSHALASPQAPRIVGLDDFAWKRRLRYGTLICDLETGLPLEMLPDRSVETIAAWLRAHPSIEYISRDGSTEYAAAIRQGAPFAKQISDRWHLTENLATCVSVLLSKQLAERRRERRAPSPKQLLHESCPKQTRAIQYTQQVRSVERAERYQAILARPSQGLSSAQMAAHLGMSDRTIRHWLTRGTPYSHPRKPRPRCIDPYQRFLLQRWKQGCHNGLHLEKELRAQGYQGSQRGIYRFLETLASSVQPSTKGRTSRTTRPAVSPPDSDSLVTLSVQAATWPFFRREADLSQEEQRSLRQLREANPTIDTAYRLVAAFLRLVREHEGDQLESWLEEVETSQLQAFASFVASVRRDQEAVQAGLTLPWSTGPRDRHINRRKLIKRSMYGRAAFDLLRLRVLWTPQREQQGICKPENNGGTSAEERAS